MPNVLTSWKEIAHYLGKGVRTIQRWEAEFGLPVRRPKSKSHHAVLALPEELDAWARSQTTSRAAERASQLESLRRELSALRAENATLRAENATLRADNAALRADIASIRRKASALRKENASPRRQLARTPEPQNSASDLAPAPPVSFDSVA
jgi:septal ring factor EnvC (AmiA/AmiB activator)